MEKNLITTEQLLEAVKNDPNNEQEYSLFLGGGFLRSTHWFIYDPANKLFGHTREWPYDWFTEAELLNLYAGYRWVRCA